MTERKSHMSPQNRATPEPDPQPSAEAADSADARIAPPDRPGEEFRNEWAKANSKEPSEMREIRAPGGWVDRFDGRGWVQEGW